jgi:hypothetical protein
LKYEHALRISTLQIPHAKNQRVPIDCFLRKLDQGYCTNVRDNRINCNEGRPDCFLMSY